MIKFCNLHKNFPLFPTFSDLFEGSSQNFLEDLFLPSFRKFRVLTIFRGNVGHITLQVTPSLSQRVSRCLTSSFLSDPCLTPPGKRPFDSSTVIEASDVSESLLPDGLNETSFLKVPIDGTLPHPPGTSMFLTSPCHQVLSLVPLYLIPYHTLTSRLWSILSKDFIFGILVHCLTSSTFVPSSVLTKTTMTKSVLIYDCDN